MWLNETNLINIISSYFFNQSQEIIKLGREYFPSLTSSLDDSKVKVHIGDGNEFLKKQKDAFDVIIIRSTNVQGWDLSFDDDVRRIVIADTS